MPLRHQQRMTSGRGGVAAASPRRDRGRRTRHRRWLPAAGAWGMTVIQTKMQGRGWIIRASIQGDHQPDLRWGGVFESHQGDYTWHLLLSPRLMTGNKLSLGRGALVSRSEVDCSTKLPFPGSSTEPRAMVSPSFHPKHSPTSCTWS